MLDRLWQYRLYIEWAVDPFPDISVGKEVPAQERNQVRERPSELGLELKVLDQQQWQ